MSRRGKNYPRPFLTLRTFSEQEQSELRASSPNTDIWPLYYKGQQVSSLLVPEHLSGLLAWFSPFSLGTIQVVRPPMTSLSGIDPFVKELWNMLRKPRLEKLCHPSQPIYLRVNRLVKYLESKTPEFIEARFGFRGLSPEGILACKATNMRQPGFLTLDPDKQALFLDDLMLFQTVIYASGNVLDNRSENLVIQYSQNFVRRSDRELYMNRMTSAQQTMGSNSAELPATELFEPAVNNAEHEVELVPKEEQEFFHTLDDGNKKLGDALDKLFDAGRVSQAIREREALAASKATSTELVVDKKLGSSVQVVSQPIVDVPELK